MEKISELDAKLKEREEGGEALKKLEGLEEENSDLKMEIGLLEDSIRKIGEDDEKLVAENRELSKVYELKEMDYRRLTENYDELHSRLRFCEEERERIKVDRDRLTSSVLDIQRTHENEICNLKGTLDYLAEKISILNYERESKEILHEQEERHRDEISAFEKISEELRTRLDRADVANSEWKSKADYFMAEAQSAEQKLHSALSDQQRSLMDLEKERLKASQTNFELKDLRQQLELKSQELDRNMTEKMSLAYEVKS